MFLYNKSVAHIVFRTSCQQILCNTQFKNSNKSHSFHPRSSRFNKVIGVLLSKSLCGDSQLFIFTCPPVLNCCGNLAQVHNRIQRYARISTLSTSKEDYIHQSDIIRVLCVQRSSALLLLSCCSYELCFTAREPDVHFSKLNNIS